MFVAGGLVLVHGLLLVEGEGGYDEETVVVITPEDLCDGQQFLLALLPDLCSEQEVGDEAAEEEDWKPMRIFDVLTLMHLSDQYFQMQIGTRPT